MVGAELLTPAPIGPGTQFRARMGRSRMEMLIELTEFDRPRRLGSRTTSPMMTTNGVITFTGDSHDTVMSWDWQVQPKGWFRMLGPLLGPVGGRMERKIWTGLKRYLETGNASEPA